MRGNTQRHLAAQAPETRPLSLYRKSISTIGLALGLGLLTSSTTSRASTETAPETVATTAASQEESFPSLHGAILGSTDKVHEMSAKREKAGKVTASSQWDRDFKKLLEEMHKATAQKSWQPSWSSQIGDFVDSIDQEYLGLKSATEARARQRLESRTHRAHAVVDSEAEADPTSFLASLAIFQTTTSTPAESDFTAGLLVPIYVDEGTDSNAIPSTVLGGSLTLSSGSISSYHPSSSAGTVQFGQTYVTGGTLTLSNNYYSFPSGATFTIRGSTGTLIPQASTTPIVTSLPVASPATQIQPVPSQSPTPDPVITSTAALQKLTLLSAPTAAPAVQSLVVAAPSYGPLIFDSLNGPQSQTSRGTGDAPGAELVFSSNVTIDSIAVKVDLATNGNLKFLIFSHPDHTLLYSSIAKFFTDDGDTWKQSDLMSFTFLAGNTYDVIGISDVSGSWDYDTVTASSNGITSVSSNPNVNNYGAPIVVGHAGADAAVRLTGIPEPGTSMLLGLPMTAWCLRRRRKWTTA